MVLSITVILSVCTMCLTKPFSPKIPFLRNLAFNQKLRNQETQPNTDAFQPEESISQESNVASVVNEFLDRPTPRNRTTRDASHQCVSRIVRVYDSCRKAFVYHVECLDSHVSCYQAILTQQYDKCSKVYGYWKAKFIGRCPTLPIGCQCAAWVYLWE